MDEYNKVFRGAYESYNNYPKNENDNLLGGLCYLTWVVSLVALVAIKPLSPFLRFHACQSLGLMIITMIVVLIGIPIGIVTIVGFCLVYPLIMALGIYQLIIMILVLTGKDHRIPLLADYIEEHFV